jgi:hypothetical protein
MQGCIYEKSNKKMYIFLKNLYKIKKKSHMNHTYLFKIQTHSISLKNHHKLIKTYTKKLFEKEIN